MCLWRDIIGRNFVKVLGKILRDYFWNSFWWSVEEILVIGCLGWRDNWGGECYFGVYEKWIRFCCMWEFWVLLIIRVV